MLPCVTNLPTNSLNENSKQKLDNFQVRVYSDAQRVSSELWTQITDPRKKLFMVDLFLAEKTSFVSILTNILKFQIFFYDTRGNTILLTWHGNLRSFIVRRGYLRALRSLLPCVPLGPPKNSKNSRHLKG